MICRQLCTFVCVIVRKRVGGCDLCMYVCNAYSCKSVNAIIVNSCEVLEYNIYNILRLFAYMRTLLLQGDLFVQVIVETFEKLVMSALRELCEEYILIGMWDRINHEQNQNKIDKCVLSWDAFKQLLLLK